MYPAIPHDICNIQNLETLIANKLGEACENTFVRSTKLISKHFQVPDCLWKMDALQNLHLMSNAYYGSLGDIGHNLTNLVLIANRFTGSIPESIQKSTTLSTLQIALNRISGTLSNNFSFAPSTFAESTVDFYANRISGRIPASFKRIKSIDILTGNLFECDTPPSNDVDNKSYVCGTSILNFNLLLLVSFSIATIVVFVLYSIVVRKFQGRLLMSYFRAYNYDHSIFFSVLGLRSYVAIFFTAILFMLLNAFVDTRDYFRTHKFMYSWSVTFAGIHGIVPMCLILFFLLCFILLVLRNYDKSKLKRQDSMIVMAPGVAGFLRRHCRSWPLITLQIMNLAIVTLVMVLYVRAESSSMTSSLLKSVLPLVIGVFKVFWNLVVVNKMLSFGQNYTSHIFVHDLVSAINLFILSPIYTIYLTDVNCFFYSLATNSIPNVTVSYTTASFDSTCYLTNTTMNCYLTQVSGVDYPERAT